jgi:hypothetical protein
MSAPSGVALERRKNGEVAISHNGTVATVLRGAPAERLIVRLDTADESAAQHLMARATGNYKRGNEKHRPSPDS